MNKAVTLQDFYIQASLAEFAIAMAKKLDYFFRGHAPREKYFSRSERAAVAVR